MKDRPKVYELAEQCGVKPRDVLEAAALLGIALQNRLTRIDLQSAEKLRRHFAGQKESPS